MQQVHHFHPELRHATKPTYVASYVFPLLFVVYEVYRVGYWIAMHGVDFSNFNSMGYEYLLMLAMFAVQVVAEGAFLAAAWLGRHPDLEHRLTNLAMGLVCSLIVLGFDYGLQVAFRNAATALG